MARMQVIWWLAASVLLACLVPCVGAVSMEHATGDQLQELQDLYVVIERGMTNWAGSGEVQEAACAARACERLAGVAAGSIDRTEVEEVVVVDGSSTRQMVYLGGSEPLVVRFFAASQWATFMEALSKVEGQSASFGKCGHQEGRTWLLLAQPMTRQEQILAVVPMCVRQFAPSAFPGCTAPEAVPMHGSELPIFRLDGPSGVCGFVRYMGGEKGDAVGQQEDWGEEQWAKVPLTHSRFARTVAVTDGQEGQCSGISLRAYEALPGTDAIAKAGDHPREEEVILGTIEMARFSGRALGELHRQSRPLVASGAIPGAMQDVHVAPYSVEDLAEELAGRFSSQTGGSRRFDVPAFLAVMYEMEKCIKRLPASLPLLVLTHGDAHASNLLLGAARGTMTQILDGEPVTLSWTLPAGRVGFVDLGRTQVSLAPYDVYHHLALQVVRGLRSYEVLVGLHNALWLAYEEEFPVPVPPMVASYYRLYVLLSVMSHVGVDARLAFPEFCLGGEPESYVAEAIRQEVIESIQGLQTTEELEARFSALLDGLYAKQFVGSDMRALAVAMQLASGRRQR